MVLTGSAFRHKKIIIIFMPQKMGTFRFDPRGSKGNETRSRKESALLADFRNDCTGIEQNITAAVIIHKERGINAIQGQKRRRSPGTARITGGSNHLKPVRRSIAAECCNDPEFSAVKRNIRRPVTKAARETGQSGRIEIADGMTDFLPVNQIAGMEDRQPREKDKRRGDKIIIFSCPDNGRIRVETAQDRIAVALSRGKTKTFRQKQEGILVFRKSGELQRSDSVQITAQWIKSQDIHGKQDSLFIAGEGRLMQQVSS